MPRYIVEENLEDLISRLDIAETEEEIHYLFGINDVFSFDEESSIFSLVVREDEIVLIHDFCRINQLNRCEAQVEKDRAVNFLQEMGYEPFMRLDLERYMVSNKDENFFIEHVEQLGLFTDKEDLGGREVMYGEMLKEEMLNDSKKEEKIKRQARDILKSVKS